MIHSGGTTTVFDRIHAIASLAIGVYDTSTSGSECQSISSFETTGFVALLKKRAGRKPDFIHVAHIMKKPDNVIT